MTSVFILYLAVIFFIAYLASRRTRSQSDFIFASRHLGPWATALGVGASDMSAWLMMALPGAFFVHGLNQIWLPLALVVFAYLNWRFVAQRLRVQSEHYADAKTLPMFFYHRFGGKTRLIRVVSALVILFFFTLYISSGFYSGALLLQTTLGWSFIESLCLGAAIIVVYCMLGGFLAVNWIDTFQGILIFIALLVVALFVAQSVGFWSGASHYYVQHAPSHLDFLHNASWISILSAVGWGLGYFGQPHILVRFMAADKADTIKTSRRICVSWMILALLCAALIGFMGAVYYHSSLADPETIFLHLVNAELDPWMAGFALAAVLSAVMSTVAAQLIGSCSTITEDLYGLFSNNTLSARKSLWFNRLMVVLIALVALFFASNPGMSLLNLVGYAWAGFGASFWACCAV